MRVPSTYSLLLLLSLFASQIHGQVQPVADYRFNGDFNDALGNAPALTFLPPANDPDPSEGNFIDVDLDGETLQAWWYPGGTGFELSTEGLVPGSTYSVALLVRIDAPFGYVKLLDTKARQEDQGLYVLSQALRYFPIATGAGNTIAPGAVRQIVVSRTPDGVYTGHVDGVEQFQFSDATEDTTISSEHLLTFLRDDDMTYTENSNGTVLRIRLFDTALDSSQVQALEDNRNWHRLFRNGFE